MSMRFVIAAILVVIPLCAQEPGNPDNAKQDKGKRPPPGPPTNLKVLKVTTGPEVVQIMRTFTAGLGVQCNYCHVQGNNASDDNPKKDAARKMIVMVQQVNANFPDGKMHVSCYTCHRGEAEPKTAPPAQ